MDDETRHAISEAMRRAVIRQRGAPRRVPASARKERTKVLEHLFELFEGNDPAEEIASLKRQDEHFS